MQPNNGNKRAWHWLAWREMIRPHASSTASSTALASSTAAAMRGKVESEF